MSSLRDLGYNLPSAVADLVDNSIAANATEVEIQVEFAGSESWIRITDNGSGMSAKELTEAMRYGSERNYTESDLGKFGLGLKTASLSQCRRLTVATRTRPDAPIQVRRWDLDLVEAQDSWVLERLAPSECSQDLTDPLRRRSGTVVFWQQLDRILDYRLPSGLAAENGLARLCREVEEHLAMVFHRFLAREAKRVLPLRIVLNGNPIEAWDPYARTEHETKALETTQLRCKREGRTHTIIVRPYVLPSESRFSSIRAHKLAAGPKKWNQQQGFYIYRGGRMIQSGGWSRLRTPDEHTKLARIGIEFQPSADCCFEINVSKMRVYLPPELRDDFAAVAQSVSAKAQSAYRKRDATGTTPRPDPKGSGNNGKQPRGRKRGGHATAEDRLTSGIIRIMKRELAGQPRLLARILRALARLDPALAATPHERGSHVGS